MDEGMALDDSGLERLDGMAGHPVRRRQQGRGSRPPSATGTDETAAALALPQLQECA
jgi:hypothetical protein